MLDDAGQLTARPHTPGDNMMSECRRVSAGFRWRELWGSGPILSVVMLMGCEPLDQPPAPPEPSPPQAVAPPPPPPPPDPPEFEPGKTYAIIETGDSDQQAILAFCDVTILKRYRLRYNRENWPTCSSRELLVGVSRSETSEGVQRVRLAGDRQLIIWEVVDLAAGVDAVPLKGRYALAARAAERDTIEIFTGRIPVYRIEPGKVHYLGLMGDDSPIAARDAKGFFAALREEFPGLDVRRFETSGLDGLDVTCERAIGSTDERITGFNCKSKPVRGGFF